MRKSSLIILMGIMVLFFISCKSEVDRAIVKVEETEDVPVNDKKGNLEKTYVNKVLKGSSDQWDIIFDIEGYIEFRDDEGTLRVNSDGSYELTITFKGELSLLKEMRYLNIQEPWGATKLSIDQETFDKVFVFKGNIDEGTLLDVSQGKEVKIIITWDGTNGGTDEIVIN